MRTLAKAVFNDKNLKLLPNYVEGGVLPALIVGPGKTSRANIAAGLRIKTGRPLVIICSDETAAENLKRDLELFLEESCETLFSRDMNFYGTEGVSRDSEQKRIKTLFALKQNKAPVVICTVMGLIQRTIPPEALEASVFRIEDAKICSPESVENALLSCGYNRSLQVEGAGQFSRRGGILDFFSPAYDSPVRCEFWGDKVDSMGFFDTGSQRRTERLESCEILPAREIIPALGDGDILLDKLHEQIKQATKRGNLKLADTLREDAEKFAETGSIAASDRYAALIYPEFVTAIDYIPRDALVFLDKPGKITETTVTFFKQHIEDLNILLESGLIYGRTAQFFMPWEMAGEKLRNFDLVMADNFTSGRYPVEPKSIVSATVKQLPSYGGSAETVIEDVKHYVSQKYSVVVLASDKRRAELLCDYFVGKGVKTSLDTELKKLPPEGSCVISVGALSTGYEYPDGKLAVLTDTQIVQGGLRKLKKKKALKDRQGILSYADLSVGDLVVHEYHGIGRFAGIFKMPVDGIDKDYVKICYAGTDCLYVPATQLDLVSKYIGGSEDRPVKLTKMGGAEWTKTKARAKAATKELAKGLIQLYAERQKLKGHAFAPDSPWQIEFEENFGYQETDDQLRCISEIKQDMERELPMDRLLCGDVGYGKTEVALRAVMKCVLDGKQAAILVPTTVLAQQHFQTALQRFYGFPVSIHLLNRYRTPAQVKQTIADMKNGKADLVIGTHRLLQKDIEFKNLGLLVVDEEQRFGVTHKERLKEMSKQVDSLTLSATPIPRTLNMAFSGLRDMSTIEEPPQDRQPVQTYVMEHDWGVVSDAIKREILRGGQVYYIHNRIESIERTASRLKKMLEDVSVSVGHGQMDEEALSGVMESMVSGDTQVLVCTTIIETGIDIPNVNTLIIEDADRLGLAQLHQLRGRVGRSSRRASAYLTFRKDKVLTEIAEKRLSAIREFAEFNSGFKIAMRDLEIRGAGNLLGAEQSGHLIDVGYDLYIKLLEEAVLEEKGEKPRVHTSCSADLAVSANIPDSYVESSEQRMDLYRRIAMIRTEEEADDLTDELIDRFGEPPSSVNALIHVALLRGEAEGVGISEISQKAGFLRFTFADFNMELVSALYVQPEYKGRVKVEAGTKPCISLRLRSGKRIIETARKFVADYNVVQASVSLE
ncbi:MAG: transcription-repair coupling factor [Oscillospiraceae bacterium]|nr:transcription-repair coupling factor [Oscillospiraceae bacterium]